MKGQSLNREITKEFSFFPNTFIFTSLGLQFIPSAYAQVPDSLSNLVLGSVPLSVVPPVPISGLPILSLCSMTTLTLFTFPLPVVTHLLDHVLGSFHFLFPKTSEIPPSLPSPLIFIVPIYSKFALLPDPHSVFLYPPFFFFFFYVWSQLAACGMLVPQPGIEPVPPALEGRVLTTEPPGKSLSSPLI